MAHLITGHAGQAHISSSDAGWQNIATVGLVRGIARGILDGCWASVDTANQITVKSGVGWIDGRFWVIPAAETVQIDSGSQSVSRNDIVGLLYEKDQSGVETLSLHVIKGTPSSSPSDPDLPSGSIVEGASEAFYPLWRVRIVGIAIDGIDFMARYRRSMLDMAVRLGDEGFDELVVEGYDVVLKSRNTEEYWTTVPKIASALSLGREADATANLTNLGSGTKTMYFHRQGNLVVAQYSGTGTVSSANTSVYTGAIPYGFRPMRFVMQGGPSVTNSNLSGMYRWTLSGSDIRFLSSVTGAREIPLCICYQTSDELY